jgi:hypothetical protein
MYRMFRCGSKGVVAYEMLTGRRPFADARRDCTPITEYIPMRRRNGRTSSYALWLTGRKNGQLRL